MEQLFDSPRPATKPRLCAKCGQPLAFGKSYCTACGTASIELPLKPPSRPVSLPSPSWAWLTILLPGLPLLIFRQPAKGLVILIPCFVLSFFPPTAIVTRVVALIDAYRVGRKLQRTGGISPWEFFPS